jgi:hypothetical protein
MGLRYEPTDARRLDHRSIDTPITRSTSASEIHRVVFEPVNARLCPGDTFSIVLPFTFALGG